MRQASGEALVESIAGIDYEIADIWDVVSRISQEDVTFYASVPHYARGYTKMFAAPNLKWNGPAIPRIFSEGFPLLLEKLGPANCHDFPLPDVASGQKKSRPPGRKSLGSPTIAEPSGSSPIVLWTPALRTKLALGKLSPNLRRPR